MKTFYVSPFGNNQNSGSRENPLASLQEAADRAAGTAAEIIAEKGTYFLNTPLTLTAKHSHLCLRSEGAVLTGAAPVENPQIEETADGVCLLRLAPLTPVFGLLINDIPLSVSRFPAANPSEPLQGSTSMEAVRERSKNWKHPETGFVRALHDRLWGGNSFRILGKEETAPHGLSLEWVGDNNRGSGIYAGKHAMVVENIREELKNPGEWFYDRKAGLLFFLPPAGIYPAGIHSVSLIQTERLISLSGQDISMEGFTFLHTAPSLFTGKYVPLMRGDWCVVRTGALFLENCSHISVKNCTFRQIGSHAVFLSGHCRRVSIEGCEIENIGACGIIAAGHPDSCREPSFWNKYPPFEAENGAVHRTEIHDFTPGPAKELYPKHIKISQTHIRNIGILEKQSSHIALSVCYDVKILHNTLHTGPRAGININDGTFGGHEIAWNEVFDMQRETDDHGMFNSWGRDRFWSLGGFDTIGQNGAEKSKAAPLDTLAPTEIHHNCFHFASRLDGGSTFGIDLDDGSSFYRIHHNLCLGMGIKLREGFKRMVHHNILIGGPVNLHCTYENAEDSVTDNLICCNPPYVLACTDADRFSVSKTDISGNCFSFRPDLPSFWEDCGFDIGMQCERPVFAHPEKNDYTLLSPRLPGFESFGKTRYGKTDCPVHCPPYMPPEKEETAVSHILWLGADASDLTDALMSAAGAGSLEGVCLTAVPPDCAAYRFGFRPMDVIQKIGSCPIRSTADLSERDLTKGTAVIIRQQKKQLL